MNTRSFGLKVLPRGRLTAALGAALLVGGCAPPAENGPMMGDGGPGAAPGSGGSAGRGNQGAAGSFSGGASGSGAPGSGGVTATGGTAADSGGASSPGGATGAGGAARTGGTSGGAGSGTGGVPTGSGGRPGTAGSTSAGGRGGGGATTAGTGGRAATGGAGGSVVVGGPTVAPRLKECRFHFGSTDARARSTSGLVAQVDMFTPGWVGQSDTFDMGYVCTAAKAGGALAGVVPTVVSYIIAFTARRDQGLQDCNVSGSTNLCKFGATYLRAHLEDRIIPQYAMYARGFATACGTAMPIVWLMEPDYYQYSSGGDANALTPQEAGQIMGRLVATVKQSLPNAIFSLDISPWIPNNGRDWYSNFNMNDFAFINTSGGGTDAGSPKIRAVNTMTWAGVHQVTGKPILADTGYGVAGAPTGHDAAWDVVANINARIADGVVGITQYNPGANWATTIGQIRSQLTAVPCP